MLLSLSLCLIIIKSYFDFFIFYSIVDFCFNIFIAGIINKIIVFIFIEYSSTKDRTFFSPFMLSHYLASLLL